MGVLVCKCDHAHTHTSSSSSSNNVYTYMREVHMPPLLTDFGHPPFRQPIDDHVARREHCSAAVVGVCVYLCNCVWVYWCVSVISVLVC